MPIAFAWPENTFGMPSSKSRLSDVHVRAKDVCRSSSPSAYPAYLTSPYHVNYQLKIITSNELQLHDILYNNASLSSFLEVSRKR